MFDDKTFSNLGIKFGGDQQLFVHKVILKSNSIYFRKMFDSRFPEAAQEEIQFFGDDPEAFRGFIAWLYGLRSNGVYTYTEKYSSFFEY